MSCWTQGQREQLKKQLSQRQLRARYFYTKVLQGIWLSSAAGITGQLTRLLGGNSEQPT